MNFYILKIECSNCGDINQVAVEHAFQDKFVNCINCKTPLSTGKQMSSMTLDSEDPDAQWLINDSDSCYLPIIKKSMEESSKTNTFNDVCVFCGGATEILFHHERYCPKCRK